MGPKRGRQGAGRAGAPTSTSLRSDAPSPPPFTSSPPRGSQDADEDEAVQDDVMDDADIDPTALLEEEKEGEDLFGEGHMDDYKAMPELDKYTSEDIDDTAYEGMDAAQRRAVETELRQRERERRQVEGRLPAAFIQADEDDEIVAAPPRRRRRVEQVQTDTLSQASEPADFIEEDVSLIEYNARGHSIREWISLEGTRRKIRFQFREFLTGFMDEKGANVHHERIKAMCEKNGESLEVSFLQLNEREPLLANFLAKAPSEILKILDEVAFEVVKIVFPDYYRIHSEIHVRIIDLPTTDTLRDLRHSHLNTLVRVSGVVTRRTSVFPQLKYVKYDCGKCGNVLGPFYQDTQAEIKVGSCPECQSKGPFNVNAEQTVYRNYQRMTLQESPGSVPAGRLPRQKEVVLLWDLIDSARPGEEIEVTGVYRNNFDVSLNNKNGFPVFATVIEANHISKKEDLFASFRLTEDDERNIRKLAKDDRIGEKIAASIAPSIYGHDNIKLAIALSLFGGEAKDVKGKHRLRGDINILLLGDPGTAKSQFLKYVEKTSHRAVYATGQGASAVGLTASVRKDPITREWTLEGGALVLADKGVCLIDEFDKMNDADRTSIHEAMEQQSISISKAGIVTSLQARCAIIAAANPVKGRYDSSLPFSKNVDLTDPILSRFDVLCVVKDIVDPVQDEKLASFVIGSHIRSHPEFEASDVDIAPGSTNDEADMIPQDTLRKYIMYARDRVHPKIQDIDQDKVANLYSELRREALASGSIPITVRHIESIIRMAEAHARMHLREYVRSDDVDTAISVCLESFISAQKFSILKQMKRAFARYITTKRDNNELLLYLLQGLVREETVLFQSRTNQAPAEITIQTDDFETRAREHNIHDVREFYKSRQFSQSHFQLNPQDRTIKIQF